MITIFFWIIIVTTFHVERNINIQENGSNSTLFESDSSNEEFNDDVRLSLHKSPPEPTISTSMFHSLTQNDPPESELKKSKSVSNGLLIQVFSAVALLNLAEVGNIISISV